MSYKLMKAFILTTFFTLFFFSNSFAQSDFYKELADSAYSLTKDEVTYDPSYYSIDNPNGDVPADKGVCTDVVIRAYRKMGIDLQQKVHEDMLENFDKYPANWGLPKPDKNIDHRRVPNIMAFFSRLISLSKSLEAKDYKPGDIVCWNLDGGITHIGIVSQIPSSTGKQLKIIHNIGAGQVVEDMLFDFEIIGHYRYKA